MGTTPAKTTVRVSLTNSAAKDDTFTEANYSWLNEDGSLKGNLAVLGNDPGSATLFSVSDTKPLTSTEQMVAQTTDTFTVCHDGVTYTGALAINTDGTIAFDLSSMQGKIDSLTDGEDLTINFYYTAKMANGVLSTAMVTVTITGVNDAPVVSIADQSVNEDTLWTYILPANAITDPDSSLTITATLADGSDLPDWLYFDASTETFSGTPPQDFNGTIDIKVTASDDEFTASDTFTLTIVPVNDAPELTGPQAALGDGTEDTDYVVSEADLLAGFSDVEGDALSVANLHADHGSVTDNHDGTYTIELDADYNGPVALTYDVTDGNGGVTPATQGFEVDAVNDAPELAGPQAALGDGTEDTDYVVSEADLLAGFSDVDGDTLSVANLLADHGSVTDNLDGTYTIELDADYNGPVALTYDVIDGNGGIIPATQGFEVEAVNDAPTLENAIANQNIDEDNAWSFTVPAGTFADVDNATLTLSATLGDGSALPGWLTFNAATGEFSGTPPLNFNGAIDLKVSASDGQFTASDTFTLTVNPVNDAPTLENAIANQNIDEDNAWNFTVPADTFADVDNATLALSATLGDGSALPAWLTFNAATGEFSGTPPLNFNGAIDLKVSASDGEFTASGTFTLTVNPVNDAPTTSSVTLDPIDEDSGVLVLTEADLLVNADDVDGDSLSVTDLAIATGLGSLSDNGDGTWNFTPASNDDTGVTFSYTIGDGHGGSVGGSASLDITPVNDDPTTSPVTLDAIGEDSGVFVLTEADLLAEADDLDGDTLHVTGLSLIGGGALVDNGDGTWNFTPASNDDTGVTFNYTIEDGNSGSVAGSASLDITPVNDLAAIQEGGDSGSVTEDAVPNTVSGNLNTTDVDSTPDSWSAVNSATATTYGSYTMTAAGEWTYALNNANATVNALNTGSAPLADSFTVFTSDGQSQVVNITINGNTDVAVLPAPVPATTTGDPNDNDALGNPLGENLSGGGGNTNDTIYGGAGSDTINGGGGNDTIYAGSGNDTSNGNNDNDTLYGGSGEDVLTGANNTDMLIGGWGADRLTGSNGNDTFKFLSNNDRGDFITDFTTSDGDKVDVSALDATHFSAGAEAFGLWAYGAGSTTVQGSLHTGTVYAADTDGNASTIEFWFVSANALSSGDFIF